MLQQLARAFGLTIGYLFVVLVGRVVDAVAALEQENQPAEDGAEDGAEASEAVAS
jgi:hypothetical protein